MADTVHVELGSPWASASARQQEAKRLAEERTQERARKREAVLRAAVRSFNEKGFHATSLDDVAVALSVTKPTIYHYFSSKDDILFACVQLGIEAVRDAIAMAEQRGGNGLERLRAIMIDYALITTRDFGMCIALTDDRVLSAASRARFRSLKRAINDDIKRVVEAGIADGSLAPGNSQLITFTLAGALNWVCRWYDPKGPLSAEQVAASCVETLLRGLAAATVRER